MTTDGAIAPYSNGGSPEAVNPSAIAGAKASAAFGLGQVLKTLVHAVPMAFHSENGVDAAVNAIQAFIDANVASSEAAALGGADVRAVKEDVSLRVPPGGGTSGQVLGGPVLDYQQLAKAILAEQAKQQKSVE